MRKVEQPVARTGLDRFTQYLGTADKAAESPVIAGAVKGLGWLGGKISGAVSGVAQDVKAEGLRKAALRAKAEGTVPEVGEEDVPPAGPVPGADAYDNTGGPYKTNQHYLRVLAIISDPSTSAETRQAALIQKAALEDKLGVKPDVRGEQRQGLLPPNLSYNALQTLFRTSKDPDVQQAAREAMRERRVQDGLPSLSDVNLAAAYRSSPHPAAKDAMMDELRSRNDVTKPGIDSEPTPAVAPPATPPPAASSGPMPTLPGMKVQSEGSYYDASGKLVQGTPPGGEPGVYYPKGYDFSKMPGAAAPPVEPWKEALSKIPLEDLVMAGQDATKHGDEELAQAVSEEHRRRVREGLVLKASPTKPTSTAPTKPDMTTDDLLAMARAADTPEKRAAVHKAAADADVPWRTLADLFTGQHKERLLKQIDDAFPKEFKQESAAEQLAKLQLAQERAKLLKKQAEELDARGVDRRTEIARKKKELDAKIDAGYFKHRGINISIGSGAPAAPPPEPSKTGGDAYDTWNRANNALADEKNIIKAGKPEVPDTHYQALGVAGKAAWDALSPVEKRGKSLLNPDAVKALNKAEADVAGRKARYDKAVENVGTEDKPGPVAQAAKDAKKVVTNLENWKQATRWYEAAYSKWLKSGRKGPEPPAVGPWDPDIDYTGILDAYKTKDTTGKEGTPPKEKKDNPAPTPPAAATPPAAPAPAPVVKDGKVIPEGSEYESNGKTYKVVGGKPVRIK